MGLRSLQVCMEKGRVLNNIKLSDGILFHSIFYIYLPKLLETMDKNVDCGIYMWHNIITDERYIGQSKELTNRYRLFSRFNTPYAGERVNESRKKYPFISCWVYSVLELCEESALNEREIFHINESLKKYGNELILNIEHNEHKVKTVKRIVKVKKSVKTSDIIIEGASTKYFQSVKFSRDEDAVEAFKKFCYGIEHYKDNILLMNVLTYVDFLLKNDGGIEIDDYGLLLLKDKFHIIPMSIKRDIPLDKFKELCKEFDGDERRPILRSSNAAVGLLNGYGWTKDKYEILLNWNICLCLYYYVMGMENEMAKVLNDIFNSKTHEWAV